MKKFTLMMIALLSVVVAFAAGPKRQFSPQPLAKSLQLGQQFAVKQAPKGLALKTQAAKARGPKKAVSAADLEGTYLWEYAQASETAEDPSTIEGTEGSSYVTISAAEDGTLSIDGMFANALTGTIDSDNDVIVVEGGQLAGTSTYGDYALYGLFYYEGDEQYEAGWYYNDIYIYIMEDGTLVIGDWLVRVLSGGQWDGYSLTPYWMPESTLTPTDEPTEVVPPANLEVEEYALSARNYNDNADVSGYVYIGFDGNDVYVQGLCTRIPESWVKGTLDGTTVTFEEGQYFGNYAGSYDMYLNVLMGEDVVFDYDAEAGVFTAQNEFFLVDNSQYYFDSYRNAVIKKVVEKAAMPADPAITALTNGNYGWYITFNVPNVDVDGNGMVSSKLSYMIYTDTEREVSPLTFTPETHTYLDEEMTEFPYGFTEDWDFYNGTIYLNDLYSKDWNKIGIKSIYRGGDEVNETEIQWFDIKDYSIEEITATFDFNKMDMATSSSDSTDGDITEDYVLESENGVVLTISPKTTSTTENRFWSTNDGPQLRVYSGTLTFEAPEDYTIVSVLFNYNGKYWGGNNNGGKVTADSGEIEDNSTLKAATWTGDAASVVFTIGANTQLNSIVVKCRGGSSDEPGNNFNPDDIDLPETVYDFNDGTLQGWSTIDADGDGFDWGVFSGNGIDETDAVYSKSYDNSYGPLEPDNYLVSPKLVLDGCITFYACAQDASYPAEHFGVYVSTNGNTDPADFEQADEWTLTASRALKAPRKVQGNWYAYSVDLRGYEGQTGYVAIRHFDCTDNFYMVVDDITLKSSKIYEPDIVVTPAEGIVESLSTINLKFNNYEVALPEAESAQAELYLNDNFDEPIATAAITVTDGKYLTATFAEQTAKGQYTVLIPDGTVKNVTDDVILSDLEYHYSIYPKELVTLPEGVEAETWYFSASGYYGKVKAAEVQVAIDGTDIYVQGINESFLPEAWIKGTIDAEAGTATFEHGQYFGAYDYEYEDEDGNTAVESYDMWFVPTGDGSTATDGIFDFDAENGILTTNSYIVISAVPNEVAFFNYYSDVEITREKPELLELVEVPESLFTEPYMFTGYDTYWQEDMTPYQVQVGFYGDNEVYIQGLSSYVEDGWVKGTLENGVLTIPETYIGAYGGWYSDYDIYFPETEFIYDAEAGTFTCEDGFTTYDDDGYSYDEVSNVVLTKIVEKATTPADPSVKNFILIGVDDDNNTTDADGNPIFASYPWVGFNIPVVDVDGDPMLLDKLSYVVYIVDKDGIEQPLTFSTDRYEGLEEDMTEIPYLFTDSWDIFTGGYTVYLNQDPEVIITWQKIGVQSIYRGLGEEHRSNIGWFDIVKYITTGIRNINADNQNVVYFDLQGRRVAAPGKGLYIANGKKVVLK